MLLYCVKHFWQTLSCMVLEFEVENLLSQYAHWNGFFLVWTLSCMFLELDWEKLLSQCTHWCGFFLVWTFSCLVLELEVEKLLSQYAHWNVNPFMYGFRTWRRGTLVTVGFLFCVCPYVICHIVLFCVKHFWQYSHWCSFSFVCIRT